MELDMANGTFSSSALFCLENPSLSLSGAGFVYDTKLGQLQVEGRVMVTIDQNSNQQESNQQDSDRQESDQQDSNQQQANRRQANQPDSDRRQENQLDATN
jgi:hypothetical protein